MSAETIPADVRELAAHYKEVWINEAKTLDHVITLAILADRATRPAEPAAPVAEAGDEEVVAWAYQYMGSDHNAKAVSFYRRDMRLFKNYREIPLVRLSTLEAERARADAAEQRVADALARAEKAERALETAQEERKAASEAMRHVGAHFPECAAEFDAIMDRKAARASREAQPATDGGDNG